MVRADAVSPVYAVDLYCACLVAAGLVIGDFEAPGAVEGVLVTAFPAVFEDLAHVLLVWFGLGRCV
jgi:hypothetical protein